MRAVFESQFPGFKLDAPAPLLIIAARDENTVKKLLPQFAAHSMPFPGGLFVHGWEREYALVRLDQVETDPETYHSVYHEYVHSPLHTNLHWLPAWLDEGIAEFYGYTAFVGDKMYIGAPPDGYRMRTLHGMTTIPFDEFLTSQLYTRDALDTRRSYMQAWALTHFLMLSADMDRGQRLIKFLELLQQDADQKEAFQEAIGNFQEVQAQYDKYVHRFEFPARALPAPPRFNDKEFLVRTMEPGETEAELAAWFIRSHEWAPMKELTATALRDGPKLSLAHEDNAFLLYNEGHDEEAQKEFSTAVELDSKNYISLFAQTMMSHGLRPGSDQDQEAMYGQLKRIIDLEPNFAPAYIELAKLDLAKRDFRLALAMSRKAERLEPFRAGYHVFTGKILLLMDHPTEAAAKAAYVAQRWSGPDRDEAMELWNRIPISQRQVNAPDLPEPDAKWHTAEGIVKQVSCNGMAFAISLDVKGETEVFKSDGFPVGYSDTFWVGRDHFSPCFHVQGLRVVLKYKPPKDNSYTGDLVYAGFRDDLVAPDARTAKAKAPAAN